MIGLRRACGLVSDLECVSILLRVITELIGHVLYSSASLKLPVISVTVAVSALMRIGYRTGINAEIIVKIYFVVILTVNGVVSRRKATVDKRCGISVAVKFAKESACVNRLGISASANLVNYLATSANGLYVVGLRGMIGDVRIVGSGVIILIAYGTVVGHVNTVTTGLRVFSELCGDLVGVRSTLAGIFKYADSGVAYRYIKSIVGGFLTLYSVLYFVVGILNSESAGVAPASLGSNNLSVYNLRIDIIRIVASGGRVAYVFLKSAGALVNLNVA